MVNRKRSFRNAARRLKRRMLVFLEVQRRGFSGVREEFRLLRVWFNWRQRGVTPSIGDIRSFIVFVENEECHPQRQEVIDFLFNPAAVRKVHDHRRRFNMLMWRIDGET